MVDLHPWSLAELRQTAIASLADAQRPENDLRTRTDLAFDGVYGLCLHFARKRGCSLPGTQASALKQESTLSLLIRWTIVCPAVSVY